MFKLMAKLFSLSIILLSLEVSATDFNQVIFFDDFNGMSFEDDPNCFTKLPICSKRAEWGDSGECFNH